MNQRAPVDFLLSQPLSETLTVAGRASDMMSAHVMAQAGLAEVLGGDDAEAWSLKAMDHSHTGDASVDFVAQFVRTPNEEES